MVFRYKEAVFSRVFSLLGGFESRLLFTVMKKAILGLLTCSAALGNDISASLHLSNHFQTLVDAWVELVVGYGISGGASVGTITGAIKGQTTETGFLHGAGIGAVTGAITAVQLMELMLHGEPFSKVALLCSLLNGKVFVEWVTPAVLKAYQWQVNVHLKYQISSLETSFREISDIYGISETRGLSQDSIKKLPNHIFHYSNSNSMRPCHQINCTICLEDFKNGDNVRILPSCRHRFHSHCIDEWLSRHGSCPVCREDV
ncbi:NEP1-interacting protein-like 2 [Cornus florida]|uniref:NEP1-interacting protein-like 2 n=1 Tax=Cornus florida TaxID=4283 RepID=UPI00289E5BAC|nr:NEP1-interacting protein-like 2 [Cornus florida]